MGVYGPGAARVEAKTRSTAISSRWLRFLWEERRSVAGRFIPGRVFGDRRDAGVSGVPCERKRDRIEIGSACLPRRRGRQGAPGNWLTVTRSNFGKESGKSEGSSAVRAKQLPS